MKLLLSYSSVEITTLYMSSEMIMVTIGEEETEMLSFWNIRCLNKL